MPGPHPLTFLVPGQPSTAGATRSRVAGARDPALQLLGGDVTQSVVVSTQRAAGGQEVPVTAVPGRDVIVMHVDRGPILVLHPENVRDLILAQSDATRGGVTADGAVRIPVRLQWRGLEGAVATRGTTRGFLGDVMVKVIEVVTGKVADKVADFAASTVVKKLDAQVKEGVYRLSPDSLAPLSDFEPLTEMPSRPNGPILVLVHGTFSTTSRTFGKLWTDYPERIRALFKHYDSAVYGLDHATLGASPIDNALTLARALPAGADIHLLTHSRGGLVAEVLARLDTNIKATFKPFAAEDHRAQLAALTSLASVLEKKTTKEKKVSVSRIVRVACPTRGTLLASKRLDAYISVFKWTLELCGIPVAPQLVELLGEVARRRADPETIPGLAAQIPDSPLVQWLHEPDVQIPGELRVVAGDIEGDSVTTWLKTLLADAFYWTDNDLVVHTRSMYGGTPRERGASYLLAQGGNVTHFSYFSNDRTAGAIVSALTDDQPRGFGEIGPLSWAGESATGTRAAVKRASQEAPDRPAVFILPGIFGSNLGVKGNRIWLGWRVANGFSALQYTAGKADSVEPDGPLGPFYDDIAAFLSKTHEVILFAYDWRRPIEDEARRLAEAVTIALDARKQSDQPVRLLAHSMGGVVARTMEIVSPKVWSRMMKHPGGRLLMLGTPNGGLWAPMQLLSGDDTLGNLMVTVGAPFKNAQTRQLIAEFPGLMQLQAGLTDGLKKHDAWKKLAEEDLRRIREKAVWHNLGLQLDPYTWGVPPQPVLDRAVKLREQLDGQVKRRAEVFGDCVVLVTGNASFTPDGYELSSEGVVYLDAAASGDGRVTLQSAMLPGVRTWSVDCEHGDLSKNRSAFEAYLELLSDGRTERLATVPVSGATRSGTSVAAGAARAPARVRSRPSRLQIASEPPRVPGDVLAKEVPTLGSAAGRRTPLRITVTHGDLTFVSEPLMLGHYRASKLTGTERMMDTLVDNKMSDALRRGQYPNAPGSHQVFLNTREDPSNPWQVPRPQAVIVVGLGEEGSLRSPDLVATVRQAVITWSQRLTEERKVPDFFSLAATLIGSGGLGVTIAESVRLIAKGIQEANERLDDDNDEKRWPRVEHLNLIELYLDRATEAWRALSLQVASSPANYAMTGPVQKGEGGLLRLLDATYRGAEYDFISVTSSEAGPGESRISYALNTTRARTEITGQIAQPKLIQNLVLNASNAENTDPLIGKTLFKLLVPQEIEAFLGGTTEMQIELDPGTAGIPWELLDTEVPGSSDSRPWAIRTKLLRKLRTSTYRPRVIDAEAESGVLIIGEPQCDTRVYPALPAARREATAVAARFGHLSADATDFTSTVSTLIRSDSVGTPGPDARTILNALMSRDWRIVHISGHGEPPELIGAAPRSATDPPQTYGAPRGVVLSDDLFLGPHEIKSMRVVPELVFVNCCFLAGRNIGQLLDPAEWRYRPHNLAQFASTVADALIDAGVRCVIAAGWAVEDGPACLFATTFYDSLLTGRRFIDAVSDAREAAQKMGGNTWAAYQCYGDPDWELRPGTGDAQRPRKAYHDEFAAIASPEMLVLALQNIGVDSAFNRKAKEPQIDRMHYLEARFGAQWGRSGSVAAAFGHVWSLMGKRAKAIEWLKQAREEEDGTAPLDSLEELANLQVRAAWETVEQAASTGARKTVLDAAREQISEARTLLDTLLAIGSTVEREVIYGSAFKRLAMIEAEAGDSDAERKALKGMKLHYGKAEDIAKKQKAVNLYYPAMNRMAAELALLEGRDSGAAFRPADVAAARESLTAAALGKPDFWSVVGQTELNMYEALSARALGENLATLMTQFEKLHDRVPLASKSWASVYDNATFVLQKYRSHARAPEKQAAAQLLKLLKSFVSNP